MQRPTWWVRGPRWFAGVLLQCILVVADESGELFLTQACHHGRELFRLKSLELPNISHSARVFKATAFSLQVHEMLPTAWNGRRMSRVRIVHRLVFRCFLGSGQSSYKCRAWLGDLQIRRGECLAFHILVAGHQAVERTGANYSRWQQSDDKGMRTSFWPGKFVRWSHAPAGLAFQHSLRMVRSPSRWDLVSPNQDLHVRLWKLRGIQKWRRRAVSKNVFERGNNYLPFVPLQTLPATHPLGRRWFRTEPTTMSCNSSNYDPFWSELRRLLWAWHRADNLRNLPPVRSEILHFITDVDFAKRYPLDSLLEAMTVFMDEVSEGVYLDPLRADENPAQFLETCVLGNIALMFVAVLVSYQAGHPNLNLLRVLYITVITQGLWVLLDGQLWPIIAADIVKLHELHSRMNLQLGPSSWHLCPCAPSLEKPKRTVHRNNLAHFNIALLGGHNYVVDIALGLEEAGRALSIPVKMNLLGYELAEKYAASAEYCELLGSNFCLPDENVKHLIRELAKANPHLGPHHFNLAKSRGWNDSNDSNDSNESEVSMDLGTAREEARRMYLQSAVLRSADFIICTFPYVLAYLLDEVPELEQPVLLIWQGGHLLEYLHEELHEWARRKLVQWRTSRRFFVMNFLDHHWLQRTLGSVPYVPYAARQMRGVLQRQVGKIYEPNGNSDTVLLHRIHFTLSAPETVLLKAILTQHFASKVSAFDMFLTWPAFEVWELINFKAIVLFPWNLELTTFLEFYRLNIPLFVPDAKVMSVLVWRYMANAEMHWQHRFTTIRKEWWQGVSCHLQPPRECAGGRPSKTPPWLDFENDMSMYQQIDAWWQETDYMKMSHVQYFMGAADLLQQLHHLDHDSLARKMRAANLADQMKSTSAYLNIFEEMLSPR